MNKDQAGHLRKRFRRRWRLCVPYSKVCAMRPAIEDQADHASLPGKVSSLLPETTWLGRQPYLLLWQRMRSRARAVSDGSEGECIWCCEHEPVYTTGMRGRDNRKVAELPAALLKTDRGGETTFHGPGQLMLYPLVDLRRRRLGVRRYVALLEESCMRTLAQFGVLSHRRCGLPGVWTEAGKIAALGVRVQNGVAYHGMALNVRVDRDWFACIEPCGLNLPVDRLDHHHPELPGDENLASLWAGQLVDLLSREFTSVP